METTREKGSNNMEELNQEKNVPEIEGDRWNWYWVCGECHGPVNWHEKSCPHCGRRLDWNGEDIQ